MNSLLLVALVGCLVFVFTVQGVDGLQCYLCSGDTCSDEKFEDSTKRQVTCGNACMKMKAGDAISRGCPSFPPSNKDECTAEGDNEVCYCSTKLCNTGTSVAASSLAMAVLSIVVTVFTHM